MVYCISADIFSTKIKSTFTPIRVITHQQETQPASCGLKSLGAEITGSCLFLMHHRYVGNVPWTQVTVKCRYICCKLQSLDVSFNIMWITSNHFMTRFQLWLKNVHLSAFPWIIFRLNLFFTSILQKREIHLLHLTKPNHSPELCPA